MEVLIGFMGLVFVMGLRRPEVPSPRARTILLLAVVVAVSLLSHKVA